MLLRFGVLSPVWGDIPPPPVKPSIPLPDAKNVKFKVVIDERVTVPRLVIPKSLMGDKKKASLEMPTIVAGLALSLGFVSGGIWLVRRGKRGAVAAAVVLALSAALFGATTLFADIGFKPPKPPVLTPVALPANLLFKAEQIEVYFPEGGEEIQLLVKKEWVKEEPKPKKNPGSPTQPKDE